MPFINFFAPFAMPFMASYMLYQGATTAMGFYALGNYEKRKIAAMSNDDFNALNAESLMNNLLLDLKQITNAMPAFFLETRRVNKMVLFELLGVWKDFVDMGGQVIFGLNPNKTPVANPQDFGTSNLFNLTKAQKELLKSMGIILPFGIIPEAFAEEYPTDQAGDNIPGDYLPPTPGNTGMDQQQRNYFSKIGAMSFATVSNHLKLYAEKKLTGRQHKDIGQKLLARYNQLNQSKKSLEDKKSQQQKDIAKQSAQDRPSTAMAKALAELHKKLKAIDAVISYAASQKIVYLKSFGSRDPRYNKVRIMFRDKTLEKRDILLIIKRKSDELHKAIKRES